MTLVVEVDGVALPDGALTIQGPNTNLPGGVQGLPLAAYFGEALTGGYSIDDPEGIYDFTGLHTIVAYETAAARPFISGGWIMGRRQRRGPYTSGTGRVHDVDFVDINWNFALMVFRAASAKRPFETDIVRAQFIRESAPMAFTPSFDNGRFNVTDNPVNFGDTDLVGTYPIEGFATMAGIAGKNFYNYFDPDEEQISLHYDLIGVGPAAGIAVSNDIADADSTTFYPFFDAELSMESAYKVTGILFGYRGAYAYDTRQATIDELGPTLFSPDGLQRDEVYRSDRFGKLESVVAAINSMLAQRAVDTDTIKFSIRVPAANVNDAYPGEIMPVKFTHLAGYETSVEVPIIRRNVVQTPGRTDMYDIHFEVSGSGAPTGPGGGSGGNFPWQPNPLLAADANGTAISTSSHQLPSLDVDGDDVLLYALIIVRPIRTIVPAAGWSLVETRDFASGATDRVALYRKEEPTAAGPYADTFTTSGGSAQWGAAQVALRSSGSQPNNSEINQDLFACVTDPSVSVTLPTAPVVNNITLAFALANGCGGPYTGEQRMDWGTQYEELAEVTIPASFPKASVAYRKDTGAAIDSTPTATWLSNDTGEMTIIAVEAAVSFADVPPPAGTEVPPRPPTGAVDGDNTDYTAPFPFSDESHEVYVDGIRVTDEVTTYEGSTGAFSLSFAPLPAVGDVPAEEVLIGFQGR